MFNPFRKAPKHPSAALALALAHEGLRSGLDPATLGTVEERGSYSGRRVTYFRVFDPMNAAGRGIQVESFRDLEAHPDLVLGFGHLESNGEVVLARQAPIPQPIEFVRAAADRSHHGDDEQFVHPGSKS